MASGVKPNLKVEVRTMTRAAYCAKNAVAQGILSSGRRSGSMPPWLVELDDASSQHAVAFIGESNCGGEAVATITSLRRSPVLVLLRLEWGSEP